MEEDNTSLKIGEYHPAADSAMQYVKEFLMDYLESNRLIEAISSTALSGDRTSELCMGTIDRLRKGDPVSDRYLLGLAWTLKQVRELNEGNANRRNNKVCRDKK